MNKKLLMQIAHKMTKQIIRIYGGDYRTQLSICLKEVYRMGKNMLTLSEITTNLIMSRNWNNVIRPKHVDIYGGIEFVYRYNQDIKTLFIDAYDENGNETHVHVKKDNIKNNIEQKMKAIDIILSRLEKHYE